MMTMRKPSKSQMRGRARNPATKEFMPVFQVMAYVSGTVIVEIEADTKEDAEIMFDVRVEPVQGVLVLEKIHVDNVEVD